ncbi:acyl-CoA dehydrogenase family protein [Rubinisphaera sp. JC750]|uniref:acyl-CoA dehydrogenase family protein n=1 Tax=Rubinisphaera sp. JC750 TaxID=2898658 RepID=UPI001F34D8D3|nr:acyl-CoA dehydrogenase family protein [Rubinisphaera sp. JC750]
MSTTEHPKSDTESNLNQAPDNPPVSSTVADSSPTEPQSTFVETALRLSGKTAEEAQKTGTIDRADDEMELLFADEYKTTRSPVHRAVWDDRFPNELFRSKISKPTPAVERIFAACLNCVIKHQDQGTHYNDKGKVSEALFRDLGKAGYWGLLVDKEYGGSEVPFEQFAAFLSRMATINPTVAGLGSVHGCIGAVDPLMAFGNEEQKRKYLPLLASGEKLSAFALTEPGAGSDLTALKTEARLEGDHFIVNGEKLFITNAIPGRVIGLVVRIDDKPAVLIAELPEEENEQFQMVDYGLYALKHSYNNGLKFRNFKVPKENLLHIDGGDGLTIAYHGLNRGRVALCATAAGTIRLMLANTLPWARYRETYGLPIEERELVRRRLGMMAAYILGCDAMVHWCGGMLDAGYRGEMECIVAKIFGSEVQKETAIELFMKTHGGRSFLHGHLFGDNVHEFLAPCIYEGEGEMLGMAFMKSLIKQHGKTYYEPIGKALQKAGIKQPNPANPAHLFALRQAAMPYLKWRIGESLVWPKRDDYEDIPFQLREHVESSVERLQGARTAVDGLMQKYQLALADRQCTMADVSQRIQDQIVSLVSCLYASERDTELNVAAADVLARHLNQRSTGRRPGGAYFKAVTHLGAMVINRGEDLLGGIEAEAIMMPYK